VEHEVHVLKDIQTSVRKQGLLFFIPLHSVLWQQQLYQISVTCLTPLHRITLVTTVSLEHINILALNVN